MYYFAGLVWVASTEIAVIISASLCRREKPSISLLQLFIN